MTNSRADIQSLPIAGDGFAISRETKREAVVVVATLERNGFSGMGECVPLKRYGHSPEAIKAEIESWLAANHAWTRDALMATLQAGPARFALDTAMWQLEAAERRQSFREYFTALFPGEIRDLPTAFTLSGGSPETMTAMAVTKAEFRWLKLKLMGDGLDKVRLRQIHAALPGKALLVDANEAFTPAMLHDLAPLFRSCNVKLVEQPFPAGKDEALQTIGLDIPLAADESCHDMGSLEALAGKYQVVNIKLDKAGGLTHALEMKRRAREMGFAVMVGCMASTSLSILPAFFLAQDAEFIDLDGALLLQRDRDGMPLRYASGQISVV